MRSREEIDADVKEALCAALKAEGVNPEGPADPKATQAGVERFLRENPALANEVIKSFARFAKSPEDDDLTATAYLALWMIDDVLRESGNEGLPHGSSSTPPS
jgi:hypothetical protein